MKKIGFTLLMVLALAACKNERKECVSACAKEAVADLNACSEKKGSPDETLQCTEAAKKKGKECLAACPK